MSQLTDRGALGPPVNRWNSARLAVWAGAARQRFPRRSATVTFSKRKIIMQHNKVEKIKIAVKILLLTLLH